MAKSERTYRRLPGTGRQVQLLTRAWLGPDHLLWVESTGFSERYKRFNYSEIQSITILRTNRGLISGVSFGGLTLVCALIGLSTEFVWQVFWFILAGLFALICLPNLFMGSTCDCYLRTAVQTEKLSSLSRVQRAHRALRMIKPYIDTAQAAADRPQLVARLQGVDLSAPVSPPAEGPLNPPLA
jgi:hypothetical protein